MKSHFFRSSKTIVKKKSFFFTGGCEFNSLVFLSPLQADNLRQLRYQRQLPPTAWAQRQVWQWALSLQEVSLSYFFCPLVDFLIVSCRESDGEHFCMCDGDSVSFILFDNVEICLQFRLLAVGIIFLGALHFMQLCCLHFWWSAQGPGNASCLPYFDNYVAHSFSELTSQLTLKLSFVLS